MISIGVFCQLVVGWLEEESLVVGLLVVEWQELLEEEWQGLQVLQERQELRERQQGLLVRQERRELRVQRPLSQRQWG